MKFFLVLILCAIYVAARYEIGCEVGCECQYPQHHHDHREKDDGGNIDDQSDLRAFFTEQRLSITQLCAKCLELVRALPHNVTEQELNDFFTGICNELPPNYRTVCMDLCKKYEANILEFLDSTEDRTLLCKPIHNCLAQKMGLCM